MEMSFRVGIGYDVHKIAPHKKLILGGVEIDAPFGLDGHSDADVITHALSDAILGAAGLPDIGFYFPPANPKWRGMNSQEILKRARAEAFEAGYTILNADTVLIAEKPKILPYLSRMKRTLSESLGIPESRIGLKATTNEGLGWIGKGEGMAAQATCLLGLL